MAEKRMFSKQITCKGKFLNLSHGAKCLYFYLSMSADDDGFQSDSALPELLSRTGEKEIQELIDHDFIYRFDSGVIVILDWNINNELKKDRYHPTKFQTEFAQTFVNKDRRIEIVSNMEPYCIQDGTNTATDRSIVKLSPVEPSLKSPVEPSQDQEGEPREGTHSFTMRDAINIASEKGISCSNFKVITALNEEKGRSSLEGLIERLNNDEKFIEYLRGIR
ncbi:MAG: hypothetical protein IJJ80_01280 [Clostridia bacterium]|nr:hypothetical protein [Clostridia bacterium]